MVFSLTKPKSFVEIGKMNTEKEYRAKVVLDGNNNILEVSILLSDYSILMNPDSTANHFNELVLGQSDTTNLMRVLEKSISERQKVVEHFGSTMSPLKLASNPKRPVLYQKRGEDGQLIDLMNIANREQCSYGSEHLKCTRMAKKSFPFCTHHLHVAADKIVNRKNLKRSRSGSDDPISYDEILLTAPNSGVDDTAHPPLKELKSTKRNLFEDF